MTRSELILAALPAVIRNCGYMGDDLSHASQGLPSEAVTKATLEIVKAMEAAIDKDDQDDK